MTNFSRMDPFIQVGSKSASSFVCQNVCSLSLSLSPDDSSRVVLKGRRVRLLCADAGAELARAGRALVAR